MLRFTLLALLVVVAGCSRGDAAAERDARREARLQRAQELASQPPKVTRYRMEAGELLVIDIATVAPGGFADSQKCFVWRDLESHSSSIACPADAGGNLPDIH